MRILSHQVYRHTSKGLPARIEKGFRYKSNSNKEHLIKQAEEIQDYMTSRLEEQVENKG